MCLEELHSILIIRQKTERNEGKTEKWKELIKQAKLWQQEAIERRDKVNKKKETKAEKADACALKGEEEVTAQNAAVREAEINSPPPSAPPAEGAAAAASNIYPDLIANIKEETRGGKKSTRESKEKKQQIKKSVSSRKKYTMIMIMMRTVETSAVINSH